MDIKDIRQKILESSNKDWFEKIEQSFNFPSVKFNKNFSGFSTIYQFIKSELDGWEDLSPKIIASELINTKGFFSELLNRLDSVINNSNRDIPYLSSYWRESISNYIDGQEYRVLLFNSPETNLLIDLNSNFEVRNNQQDSVFHGAFHFIINRVENRMNRDYLKGIVIAYEFISKDFSEITERKNSEKASFSRIRSDALKYIDETERNTLEKIQNTDKKFTEYSNRIDILKSEKEELFDNWFKKSKEDFNSFDESSLEKIKLLEDTYKNKLRLDGPAKYWKDRAERLKTEGRNHLYLLVVLVIFSGILIFLTLYLTPDMILHSFFEQDKSIAIRWSIMYFIFIGFLAFGIRVLTKIVLSSFHLSRDAEEREHLSFFFLSLAKETQMEKEERLLILQSLFSRADTGLLKDDSAPTMPGTSDILKILNR